MSFSKPSLFDFVGQDSAGESFIPLYEIPREEIKNSTTSSISRFIKKHIHPPTTKYSLISAQYWIRHIDNSGAHSKDAEQVAKGFRLPIDKTCKIMTEADSLMPLDKHVIPIINYYLSRTQWQSVSQFEIQHQAELTIALKDIQKEDVKPGGVTYPIFRPDRVYLKTYTDDEPRWISPLMAGVSYGSYASLHGFARDDHAGPGSARDDALSADDAEFVSRDEESTGPTLFKGEYGMRSQKYFPNADNGRAGRSKGFVIIEGKMAGILLRCKSNIEAAATSPRPFGDHSLSLLKQAYAYALAFRTQHVALYDYTTLILILWPHMDTTESAYQLWTYWNNPVSAGDPTRLQSAITVITNRDLMVPALAGFMTDALQTCNHRWHPDLQS